MKVEFDSMKRCDLLRDLVQLLENGKVIGMKWVFKQKQNLDGIVERCRARLVGKDYRKFLG